LYTVWNFLGFSRLSVLDKSVLSSSSSSFWMSY